MALFLPPTQNAVQYTLDTGYTAGGSVLTLNATLTGVIQAPGVCVVNRIDASGNKTSGKREYFTFTGVSGQQLTGCTGGLAGSTAQDHGVGAIVEFTPDVLQQQAIYDAITAEHDTSGKHTNITGTSAILTGSIDGLNIALTSTASVYNVTTTDIYVKRLLYASGASIVGISAGGAGGFNGLFWVPGALSSQANVAGLIPLPLDYTASFIQAYVQTPASVASISATVLMNNSVIGVVAINAGATFASSASLSTTALTAGSELRLNINSTASSAQDLSVLIRAA